LNHLDRTKDLDSNSFKKRNIDKISQLLKTIQNDEDDESDKELSELSSAPSPSQRSIAKSTLKLNTSFPIIQNKIQETVEDENYYLTL
jgi:hypothetical protein